MSETNKMDKLILNGQNIDLSPDYQNIRNKPTINGVTVDGNKTLDDFDVATKQEVENVSEKVANLPYGIYYGQYDNVESLPDVGELTQKGYAYVSSTDPSIFYIYIYDGEGNEWQDSGNKFDSGSLENNLSTKSQIKAPTTKAVKEGIEAIDVTLARSAEDENELTKAQKYNASANINNREADINPTTAVVESQGYKVLNSNASFTSQVTESNTIYEIRDKFDLDNESISIPSNSTLYFNGGSVVNGTITYQNTYIEGEAIMDVSIASGSTIRNESVNIAWFGAKKGDSTFDNGVIINKVASIFKVLYLGYGTWYYSTPITFTNIISFECNGSMRWNNASAINVDTITLNATGARIHIYEINNAEGVVSLRDKGFFNNFGKNFSVRAFTLRNCYNCTINVDKIINFNEGIRFIGIGAGCCYNHLSDLYIAYTNIGVRMTQQNALGTVNNIDVTVPVLNLWTTSSITLEANDVITLPEDTYLVNSSMNGLLTVVESSYTASEATTVYIATEEYNEQIQYSKTSGETTTQIEAYTTGNGILLLSSTTNGISNKYMTSNELAKSNGTLVLKEGQMLYRLVDGVYKHVATKGAVTLTSSYHYYIVTDAEENSEAIYAGTQGWTNNNFVDTVRHLFTSDEANYVYLASNIKNATIEYSIKDQNENEYKTGNLIVATARTINGTTYYYNTTGIFVPYGHTITLTTQTENAYTYLLGYNSTAKIVTPNSGTTNEYDGKSTEQHAFLIKGPKWENPNQNADKDNFLIDTYDHINALYVSNVSCEGCKSDPAIYLHDFSEGRFYVSRAEATTRTFKLEGNCYSIELDVQYGNFGIDATNFTGRGNVSRKGIDYDKIVDYNINNLTQEGNYWIDKENNYYMPLTYFSAGTNLKQGYVAAADMKTTSNLPKLTLTGGGNTVGFKLRSKGFFNKIRLRANRGFRFYIKYLTMVENDVERDVTDIDNLPGFTHQSAHKLYPNVYTVQSDTTNIEFHIPYNVRNFFVTMFTGTSSGDILRNCTIDAINITDIKESYTTKGDSTSKPAHPYTGMIYYDTTIDDMITWNGSAWEPIKHSGTSLPTYLTEDNAGFMFFITNRGFSVVWNGTNWTKLDNTTFVEIGGAWSDRPENPTTGILFDDTDHGIIRFNGNVWVKDVIDSETQETSEVIVYDNDDTETDWGTVDKRRELTLTYIAAPAQNRSINPLRGLLEYQFKRSTDNKILRFDGLWKDSDGNIIYDTTGANGTAGRTVEIIGTQHKATAHSDINGGFTIAVSNNTANRSNMWNFNGMSNAGGGNSAMPYNPQAGYLYFTTTNIIQLCYDGKYWRTTAYVVFTSNFGSSADKTLANRLTLHGTNLYRGMYYTQVVNDVTSYLKYDGQKWLKYSGDVEVDVIDAEGTYEELNSTEGLADYYNYQCYATDLNKNIIWKHGAWYYMDEYDSDDNLVPVTFEEEEEEIIEPENE